MEQQTSPRALAAATRQGNVRLRFFLGPTNLGILQCADEVMAKHPVIIHQVDYRFDVYGRPHDVAAAITESFLMPQLEPTEHQAHDASRNGNSACDPRDSPHFTAIEANRHKGPSIGMTRNDQGRFNNQDFGDQFNSLSVQDQEVQDDDEQDSDVDVLPFYRDQTLVPGGRGRKQNRIRKGKTDASLERNRQASLNSTSHGTEPGSVVVIILSMQVKIAHYLLHRSGGFMSYLVEEPDLETCARKSMTLEGLESVSQTAGMSIALSDSLLPDLIEVPIWVQIGDMRALRAILEGVALALSKDPLYSYERKWTSKEELALRMEWDAKLSQHEGPQESPWVKQQNNKEDPRQPVPQSAAPRPAQDQDDHRSARHQNSESNLDEWTKSPRPGGTPLDPSQTTSQGTEDFASEEQSLHDQYKYEQGNHPPLNRSKRNDRPRSDNGKRRSMNGSESYSGRNVYDSWRGRRPTPARSRSRSVSPTPGTSSLTSSRYPDQEAGVRWDNDVARAYEWASQEQWDEVRDWHGQAGRPLPRCRDFQ